MLSVHSERLTSETAIRFSCSQKEQPAGRLLLTTLTPLAVSQHQTYHLRLFIVSQSLSDSESRPCSPAIRQAAVIILFKCCPVVNSITIFACQVNFTSIAVEVFRKSKIVIYFTYSALLAAPRRLIRRASTSLSDQQAATCRTGLSSNNRVVITQIFSGLVL